MNLKEAMLDDIREVFLDEADGSVRAVLWREGYAPVDILVNYTAAGTVVDTAAGAIETSAPEAEAASADLPGASHGDVLEIAGERYEIIGMHPDGAGMTRLVLSLDGAQ